MGNIIPSKGNAGNDFGHTDDTIKAEELNEAFVNVGKRTFEKTLTELNNVNDKQGTLNRDNTVYTQLFRPEPVDANTVILTIKHLKNTNSTGSDGISLRHIRDSLPVTIEYITTIINTSIVTGKFPSLWKNATVTPIYKHGDRNDVNNFRPISLLPILSKILEKIVAQQLNNFLESNKVLSTSQHGFRPRLSTETALTTVSNKLYSNIDKKKLSLVTLLDLSKAFDSVHHDTLLRKLTRAKVDNFWFNDYLKNRSQQVKINTKMSKTLQINFGVPQGSVLGPILFNLFINDLTNTITGCDIIQYADDTQLIHTGSTDALPDLIERAEATLSLVQSYFSTNRLMINTRKAQCIFVGTIPIIKQIPPDTKITFNNTSIAPSTHVKNLGITMDNHMSFDAHIK